MSSISGYFFAGSKSGGFTIQPWICMPSFDVYQISSRGAELLAHQHVVVDVGEPLDVAGALRLKATTSFGCDAVLITPTAMPFGLIDVTVSTCLPVVTGFTSPRSDAKYRLRAPSFSALK